MIATIAGEGAVVRVQGAVALTDVRELRRTLRTLLAQGAPRLVLDLTDADDVPVGHLVLMLLGLRHEAATRDARIVLAPPPATYARLSGTAALLGIVDIAPTAATAA